MSYRRSWLQRTVTDEVAAAAVPQHRAQRVHFHWRSLADVHATGPAPVVASVRLLCHFSNYYYESMTGSWVHVTDHLESHADVFTRDVVYLMRKRMTFIPAGHNLK